MGFIVYIMGAAGTGKTSLGAMLSERYGYEHFDIDEYFWEETDPPFQAARPRNKFAEELINDISGAEFGVLTGNLGGGVGDYISLIALSVFLDAPTDVRLKRLKARERERFGDRIEPGGDMHQTHIDFMEWAEAYEGDDNRFNTRQKQEWQIKKLQCPVIRVDATQERDAICRLTYDAICLFTKYSRCD
jgi:adenylate kinase family enzyme